MEGEQIWFTGPEKVNAQLNSYSHISECLQRGLDSLRQDGACTDFEVIVQGQSFKCHKVILAAMSDFFRAMFQSGMQETVKNQVVIDNVTPETFQLILDLMYYKDIRDPDPLGYKHNDRQLRDLIVAADMFQMIFLQSTCRGRMGSSMNFTNCVARWKMCNTLPSPDTAKVALQYIVKNFDIDVVQENLMTLDYDDFFPIIASPDLKVKQEISVWQVIAKWIDFDMSHRSEKLPDLLECCSLTEIDRTTLIETLAFDKRIRHNDAASKLVQNAIKFKSHPGDHGNIDLKFRKSSQFEQYQVMFAVEEGKPHLLMQISSLTNDGLKMLHTGLPNLTDFACCVHGSEMYLCGGKLEDDFDYVDCLFKGKLSSKPVFVELERMQSALIGHSMVATDTSLFVIGGTYSNGQLNNAVQEYIISSNEWKFHGVLDMPNINAPAVHINGKIYFFGGKTGCPDEPDFCMDVIQSYDINTSTPTRLVSKLPSPCALSHALIKQDKIIVITGSGEIIRLSDSALDLELIATIPDFGKRTFFGVRLTEDAIKLYGGITEDREGNKAYSKEVITYNMKDGTLVKDSTTLDRELAFFGNLRVIDKSSLLSTYFGQ